MFFAIRWESQPPGPREAAELPPTDLSSLETVFYGASPMSPVRLREAIRAIGPVFFQFYGQTEAAQTICVLRDDLRAPQGGTRRRR